MADADKEKARELENQKQAKITKQWKNFAKSNGREAYRDLMEYIDSMGGMYIKYAEDRAMPHPQGNGKVVMIDNETIGALLQNKRGMSIIQTYIRNRVESDVAQSTN